MPIERLRIGLVILRTLLFALLLPDLLVLSGGSERDTDAESLVVANTATMHEVVPIGASNDSSASPAVETTQMESAWMLLRLVTHPDLWVFLLLSNLLWAALRTPASAREHIEHCHLSSPLRLLLSGNVYSIQLLCAVSAAWRLLSMSLAPFLDIPSGQPSVLHPALWYRAPHMQTVTGWVAPFVLVDTGILLTLTGIWVTLRLMQMGGLREMHQR